MSDPDPGGGHYLVLLQSTPSLVLTFLVVLLLAGLYAFATAYAAVIPRLDEDELRDRLGANPERLQAILGLKTQRRQFLSSIHAIKILSLLLLSWALTSPLEDYFQAVLPQQLMGLIPLFIGLALVFVSFLIMAFARSFPQELAKQDVPNFSLKGYKYYYFFSSLLAPLSRPALGISDSLLKRRQIDPDGRDLMISDQEVKDLLEHSAESEEGEFLENVFAFGDKTVGDCMTHRMDMVAVEANISLPDLLDLVEEEKYTRIPVYREDIDHIIGLVYIRDILLFAAKHQAEPFSIDLILKEASYTPETQSIAKLFRQMQLESVHMAIVIDEYGGTAGLITLEDVLEEIVGDIEDEYDDEEEDFLPLGPGEWLVDSSLTLEDLSEYLDTEFPSEDYDTVAGLVIGLLDRIPEADEQAEVRYEDYLLKVLSMDDKRIEKILIKYEPAADPAEDMVENENLL